MSEKGPSFDLYSDDSNLDSDKLLLKEKSNENQLPFLNFELVDLFSTQWEHIIESAPSENERNLNNNFMESNNSVLLALPNPILDDDLFHNLLGEPKDSSIKIRSQNSINQIDSLDQIESLNMHLDPQSLMNNENNNMHQIVQPKNIKNYIDQHIEDEINSSPQIFHKSGSKKSELTQTSPYHFQYSSLASKIFHKQQPKRERKNFTQDQKKVLLDFIEQHKDNPYIDNYNVTEISGKTGLSNKQIRIFLTNYRTRNSLSQKKRNRRFLNAQKE